jgi:hypothetical protein
MPQDYGRKSFAVIVGGVIFGVFAFYPSIELREAVNDTISRQFADPASNAAKWINAGIAFSLLFIVAGVASIIRYVRYDLHEESEYAKTHSVARERFENIGPEPVEDDRFYTDSESDEEDFLSLLEATPCPSVNPTLPEEGGQWTVTPFFWQRTKAR